MNLGTMIILYAASARNAQFLAVKDAARALSMAARHIDAGEIAIEEKNGLKAVKARGDGTTKISETKSVAWPRSL